MVQAAGAIAPAEQCHGRGGAPGRAGREQLLAPSGVRFVDQTEQKGTGHALLACRDSLASEPGLVVVLYGDCPLLSPATLAELVRRAGSASDAAATLITTRLDDPTGYGRIIFGETTADDRAAPSWSTKPPRPRNSRSRSSTPASIVSARTCCGSTCSKSVPIIRLTNTI